LWLGAACVLATLAMPCEAAAQRKGGAPEKGADAGKKEDSPKKKAAPYLKAGARAATAGEWEDAYAEYSIAWTFDPSWEVAAGLGKAAYKAGYYAESIRRLSFYLREAPPKKVSAKARKDAETMIQDAKSKTGEITITAPEGSTVLIDDQDFGNTPLADPLIVDPGKRKVEVRRGSQGESRTADVTAGSKIALDFMPKAPPPPKTVIVQVKEEGLLTPQTRTAGVIAGGALALGALAAGGISLGVGFAKGSERQTATADPFGRETAKAAAQTEADAKSVALWCFVGGGVAAVGTTVFYLVTRPRVRTPPVQAGAAVAPSGGVIWARGTF
jgi:hypothetical protein